MPRYFFDTSAFTKIYHGELGSARTVAMIRDKRSSCRISNLVILETQSALAMKVRTGVLDQRSADSAMDRVFHDVASGLIIAIKIDESHVNSARALVAKYGYSRRMRTLDALQLAVALDLSSRRLLDVFVVAANS